MNKTKKQIARQMYGCKLDELSGGEKAAVTRAFNKQTPVETAVETERVEDTSVEDGFILVKFGRPGINGTKESIVKTGATVQEALDQSGFTINPKKEGIIKKTGEVVKFADVAEELVYIIAPGVDSSN